MTSATAVTPAARSARNFVGRLVFVLLLAVSAALGSIAGLLFVYSTDLPQITELERYRPNSITELYDDQGRVIGSFALERRVVVGYDDFSPTLRNAILSIEDKEFEKHWGINFWRVAGSAYHNIFSGERAQGASTLTMQLARNLFLSPDRTLTRKIQEVMLSIQIERRFTKQQIFTLYANQIFLGHGAYGFEAGAQYYFSKHAKDLTLDEAALLAGLPKAPSAYSPINSPERALRRRNLVINNMLEDGKINVEQAQRAKAAPIELRVQSDPNSLAPYFSEEVRRYLEKKFGSNQVHEGGLRVYTTLDAELQQAANLALLDGLAAYERRHGWKGRLLNIIAAGLDPAKYEHPDWRDAIGVGSYVHALVTQVKPTSAVVRFGRYTAPLSAADLAWTKAKNIADILSFGDIVYVKVKTLQGNIAQVSLEQDSGTQGALLAIDNVTGDIRAMVGGRDFNVSKFNRATQALRQTGSSFKPYVYTAAIDQGAMPDDIILDAPTTFSTASGPYTPRNYDGKFEGNITLRRALSQSRNIPALKLADHVGIGTVIDYARRFGITSDIPRYLPVALGAADTTLYEQTSAFSAFPNDGVRVIPRMIRKVVDYEGHVLEENYPEVRDVVSPRTARIMTGLLQEVVRHGTALKASKLGPALAGKTGTTNDFTDAWFVGFSPSTTCGVWIGFDEKKTLGNRETGAEAALPIWMDFMKVALRGHEDETFPLAPPPPTPAVAKRVDTPDLSPGDGESN